MTKLVVIAGGILAADPTFVCMFVHCLRVFFFFDVGLLLEMPHIDGLHTPSVIMVMGIILISTSSVIARLNGWYVPLYTAKGGEQPCGWRPPADGPVSPQSHLHCLGGASE